MDTSILIPCDIPRYIAKGKETGKERKTKRGTKTIMHAGSRPSRKRTRLVFAVGMVSPHLLGNRRTTTKTRPDKARREGRDKETK